MSATARKFDANGWYEVKRNPISKAGVFQYSGDSIGGENGRIYNVYRPASELSSQETLDSFKLIPWVDDHTMLGKASDGLTPAERKSVEGVIGEDVFFEGDTLYGNVKVFSDKLANLIDKGKKELSAGYRCVYKFVQGVYNGVAYDAIQCNIRGNNLALVNKGRMGPDVAVLDHFKFTIDSGEFQMSEKKEPTLQEQIKAAVDAAMEPVTKEMSDLKAANDKLTLALDEAKKAMKDDGEEEEEMEDGKACDKKATDKKGMDKADKKPAKEKIAEKKDTVDAAEFKKLQEQVNNFATSGKKAIITEVAERDALVKKLSSHIGAFDAADKTLDEVAAYGLDKLKLECEKGQELATLKGFLHNRAEPHKQPGIGTDTSGNAKTNAVDAFLNPKK